MRRFRSLGRQVVGPSVALVSCLVSATCGLVGSRPPSPLRGYRMLIEARDSLSDYLASALSHRGFTVGRRIKGGSHPTAALVTFVYTEAGPGPATWFNARLADTRSGVVVAAVTAPLDSLGPTARARAESLADSLAARLTSHPPVSPP